MSAGDMLTTVADWPRRVMVGDPRFRLAWELLDRADELSSATFRRGKPAFSTKPDSSVVTEVDLRVERLLIDGIAAAFRSDSILAEESGDRPGGDHRWIIDPLDGSSNFVERVPIYAHQMALTLNGKTIFAMVSAPMLGRRWWAYHGQGAFEGGIPVSVSATAQVSLARIAYGGLRDYDDESAEGIVRLIRRCARARGFGNFFPHMLVAEGTYDLASSGAGSEAWDIVPLALIIEEAGGRITALSGFDWTAPDPVLATNSVLHAEAMAIIRNSR